MELLISYSLQDFLLFSADTWFFLYLEFSRKWWFLAVVTGLLLFLAIVTRRNGIQIAAMLTLLLCNLLYYLDFYIQINDFANYLMILLVLQLGLYLYWTLDRQGKVIVPVNRGNKIPTGMLHRAVVLTFVLTLVTLVFLPFFKDSEIVPTLFLPGWQVVTSALLFVFFTRYLQRIPLAFLAPIILVIMTELLTFKVLLIPYWWLGGVAFIAAVSSKY